MPNYQLTTPAQHPVITLVDINGNPADLSGYIPPGTYADSPTPGTARTAVVTATNQTVAGVKDFTTDEGLKFKGVQVARVNEGPLSVLDPRINADNTGATDAGPAINAARAMADDVFMPPGQYKVETVIDYSNVHPTWDPYIGTTKRLKGAGHQATILTGGEAGFGFIELVGSNRLTLEGFSIQATGSKQYGILGGRKTGNASSSGHVFRDVYVYGSFTLGGIFMLSSESCTYEQCIVYTTAGPAMVLARDLRGWTATAKHTALSTSNPISGGNGVLRLDRCLLVTIRTPANGGTWDSPLVLEYAQTFDSDSLYMLSSGAPLVLIDKGCHQAKFDGLHQEWNSTIPGATEPYGVYVKDTTTGSEPKVVRMQFDASSLYPIYGEDNQKFSGLSVRGSGFRTNTRTFEVDVWAADRSDLPVYYTAIGTHEEATPTYRARTGATRITADLVIQPEQFGAVGDGTADDTTPVTAAFAAATALRSMVVGGNVFEPRATVRLSGKYNLASLSSQIVASCNIDGAEGVMIAPAAYAGTVLLLGHETSGLLLQSALMRLPRVTKAAGVTTLPVGSVGIKVQNCYDCDITGRRVDWFETDWLFTGLGQGTAYNRINLGRMDLAKVTIALIPGTGGWVNQNRFVGGGISQAPNTLDGGLTTDIRRSGWRHLVIDGSAGVGTVNGNTFDGVSFEGDLSEFFFDIKHASNNTWQGATRFEQGTAARATTLATDTFTHVAHGLAVGDMVVFAPTTLPGGMRRGEAYFVSSVPTADTFKVAETKGGSSASFTTNGSGVTYYVQPRILIDGTGGNTYANEIKSGYFSATGPLDIREINATRSNPVAPPLPRQGTAMSARNRIINGDFRINQRAYASGGALAVGAFGFDRWKSNQASTSLTFTSAPQGRSVLLDGYIQQVLERGSVPAGTYTLSWEGNAQGRVFNSGALAPALAQGPITVDIDGTADVVVEFFGTMAAGSRLFRVQLELGRIASPFEQMAPALQLEQCKRFFQRFGTGTGGREIIGSGIANSTTSAFFACRLAVEMRSTPTVAVTSSTTFRVGIGTLVILAVNNGVTLDATSNARSLRVNASVASGLTAGQAAMLDTGDGYFDLSAEL